MQRLLSFIAATALFALSSGCDGSDPDTSSAPDAAPTLESLVACDEVDFAPSPFMGPAFDDSGQLTSPLPTPHIVATTSGWARPEASHRDALGAASGSVTETLFASPGLLGVTFGGSEVCNTARTLSLWVDEASLDAFVYGGAHAAAMPLVPTATLGWETTRWTEMSDQPTTWDRARAALAEVRPAR